MNITKSDVEKYLSDVFVAVRTGRFQISPRQKNQDIYKRYVFTEEEVSLYIKFNKLANHFLIVISFHKQEYPLTYKFK